MGSVTFAYVGILFGALGLFIGSVFGPTGAFFGLMFGLIFGALYWKHKEEKARQLVELERRVSKLEGENERTDE